MFYGSYFHTVCILKCSSSLLKVVFYSSYLYAFVKGTADEREESGKHATGAPKNTVISYIHIYLARMHTKVHKFIIIPGSS